MSPAEYPSRPPLFALRFLKLLAETYAATSIGADGAWLLTAIVTQEDAVRYRPVDFFNGQLLGRSGLGSVDTLARVRERLVKAGWLHYESRAKRLPGVYWVQVPDMYRDAIDATAVHSAVHSAPVRSEQADTPHGCGDNASLIPHPCGSSAEPPLLTLKDTLAGATPSPAPHKTGKSKTPASGRSKQPAPHPSSPNAALGSAIGAWKSKWSAKYGERCSVSDADGNAIKWMLSELDGDVDRFGQVVSNYLAREDKYLTPNRHPLLTLRSQFNTFKVTTATGPPAIPVTQQPDF